MRDRDYAIDFLKTVAIIAVVGIHVSTAYLDRTQPFGPSFDIILTINGFVRFAVPLFFLTSGLLLGARYKTIPSRLDFYKKRVFRILPPYVFWTFVYYLFFAPSLWMLLSWNFVNNFITGDTSYQFYFIPTIFILYTLFPFFIRYRKIFLSKVGVLGFFMLECIFLYYVYYDQFKLPLFSPLRNALINLAPFLIGIFLSEHYERTKRFMRGNFFLSFFLYVLTGTIIVVESILLFAGSMNMNYVNNQWRPSVLVYSLSAGALFYNLFEKYFHKWGNIILWLSKFSFGVFFIHVALMYPLLQVIDTYKFYGFLSFLLFLILTVTGSYLIIFFSSKIPKIGRIVSAT